MFPMMFVAPPGSPRPDPGGSAGAVVLVLVIAAAMVLALLTDSCAAVPS